MLTYLPRYYEKSNIMQSIINTQGREIDELKDALDGTLGQCFVDKATWGLSSWEEELGLKLRYDLTLDEKRDIIKSLLCGRGTAKISVLKDVAKIYDNSNIDVIENYDLYTIIIKFKDPTGIPKNLAEIKKSLRSIVPAHLSIEYQYNYYLWDELDEEDLTWDRIDGLNLSWNQWEVRK